MLSAKYKSIPCRNENVLQRQRTKKRKKERNRFIAHNQQFKCAELQQRPFHQQHHHHDPEIVCEYTNVRHSIGFNHTNNNIIISNSICTIAKYAYSSVVDVSVHLFFDWFSMVWNLDMYLCKPLNINTFIAGRNWLYYNQAIDIIIIIIYRISHRDLRLQLLSKFKSF